MAIKPPKLKVMKKIVLLITVLLFGCYSIQAQMARSKGQAQNYEVLNTDPVKAGPMETYFEDFEGLTDFALNFPPWTLVDVDGSTTYGFEGIDFANEYAPMAFIVFNPSQTTPVMADEEIQPHGGNKFAACFASEVAPNNDWIISQEGDLGSNSSLSFWVKSFTGE